MQIKPSSQSKEPALIPAVQSPCSFEDIQVDDSDENFQSFPPKKEPLIKSNCSTSPYTNNRNLIPKQHNLDEQMLLESMLETEDNEHNNNHQTNRNHNRLSHKSSVNAESDGVFLLLNANEHLTVSDIFQY